MIIKWIQTSWNTKLTECRKKKKKTAIKSGTRAHKSMTLTKEKPAECEWRKHSKEWKLWIIYAKLMFSAQENQFQQ